MMHEPKSLRKDLYCGKDMAVAVLFDDEGATFEIEEITCLACLVIQARGLQNGETSKRDHSSE